MNHKDWLDNEYNLWIEALQSSTVNNFKENPTVKRMLGEVDPLLFLTQEVIHTVQQKSEILLKIDSIGYSRPLKTLSGTCLRMIYYALQVLEKKPKSIVEIGGGVGEFYAIMRALGYEGDYYIYDLPEVQHFQHFYLGEVTLQTGFNFVFQSTDPDYCVSFYALGEFDDKTKEFYIRHVVNECEHGFIVWNAHSGANGRITFKHNIEVKEENPLTLERNLQITW